ncbi:hypothetical protein GGI43DRAFT_412164 [Trichoderma evansii]
MHFSILFASIALVSLPQAAALAMPEGGLAAAIDTALETYDIDLDFHYYHDYGIVDIDVTIPGINLKEDHIEAPTHIKANASPIHMDQWDTVNIYFKNDWTDAHRWEASIPIIGPTLYVDLQSRFVRSNCKLGLKLHLTGTGILGRLDESIDLGEFDNDGIKFLAQGKGLC